MIKELFTIYELMEDEDKRFISPNFFYQEDNLLLLIFYWFSLQSNFIINSDSDRKIVSAFKLNQEVRCYTQATLSTPFGKRVKGEKDSLAEPNVIVSGAIGHFRIKRKNRKEKLVLKDDATHFNVIKALLKKELQKGIKANKKYNEVARIVGCMVQAIRQSKINYVDHVGVYILAPEKKLSLDSFKTYTYKQNIEECIKDRVNQYGKDSDKQDYLESFNKLFSRFIIECISYEDIIRFIRKNDRDYGDRLEAFYQKSI